MKRYKPFSRNSLNNVLGRSNCIVIKIILHVKQFITQYRPWTKQMNIVVYAQVVQVERFFYHCLYLKSVK